MSTAAAIAKFVADTPFEAIPPGALARARSCLVDTLGAALGGSRLRAGRIAVALVEAEAGAGVATVLTARRKAAISQAAFANAVLASALDVDDGHYGAVGHPGAPVIPPALATAEARRRSGRELLGAVVVGYEIAIRAGEVLNARVGVRSYGSGTPGAYGAAAAVARLLGLDAGRTAHALGIARCHLPVSTVWDSVPYGAMVKESIGWGAITGTVAALLAEQGFTGPETVLDEPHHRAESDLAPLDDLGARYRVTEAYVKRFPACLMTHAAIDATLALRNRLDAEQDGIAGVTVWSQRAALALTDPAPRSPEGAQYSIPYTVAAALVDGVMGVDQLLDERLDDRRIRDLAARVEVRHDPRLDAVYPARRSARVTIRTVGGRTYEKEVRVLHGSSEDPLTADEVDAKFLALAEPVVGKERAARALGILREVEAHRDLSPLWQALAGSE
ncbi:MAG: MmgE/PrpD family protein [Candidatus Rokubacteria bacterium]|nr:MmgE/PrpD family protein [Candidatus Rokubacteria bacterium]